MSNCKNLVKTSGYGVYWNIPSDAHPELPVAKGESWTPQAAALETKPEFGVANFLADSVKCASLNKLRFGFAPLSS